MIYIIQESTEVRSTHLDCYVTFLEVFCHPMFTIFEHVRRGGLIDQLEEIVFVQNVLHCILVLDLLHTNLF